MANLNQLPQVSRIFFLYLALVADDNSLNPSGCLKSSFIIALSLKLGTASLFTLGRMRQFSILYTMYACNRWLYYPYKTPHSENLLKPVRTLQNLTYLIKPQFNYLYATQMTAVCLNTLVNLCNKFNQLFNMKHLFVI
mgnify:CR=1 FL=1